MHIGFQWMLETATFTQDKVICGGDHLPVAAADPNHLAVVLRGVAVHAE